MLLSTRVCQCYAAASETKPTVEFSEDGLLLMLNGIKFATVEFVPDDEWPELMEDHWASHLERFNETSPYPTEHLLHMSLAETTFLSQKTFPPKTPLIPYSEDHLIYRAESYLGFSFDGSGRVKKEIREDMTFLGENETTGIYRAIRGDHRGEFRAIDQRCNSSDTIGDEF
jgi:hypothetical protein